MLLFLRQMTYYLINLSLDLPLSYILTLIPQHYSLTLFISAWATKSCPGFCHVRIFTYLSVAKRRQAKL